jgi:hypothetical protein
MRSLLALVLLATTAHADTKPEPDARVELPDLSKHFNDYAGKIIKIPGALDTKPTAAFGCGFEKSKYVALEIDDRGSHLIGYCKRADHTLCDTFTKAAHLQYALVAMPKKPGGCKEQAVELLDY